MEGDHRWISLQEIWQHSGYFLQGVDIAFLGAVSWGELPDVYVFALKDYYFV